jgi:threonylcarbamoyladenosine tRNA methylthiotransferase MtaB
MAKYGDKVCPHLHISMQSGSEEVLRRMRRRWGAKRFVDRCQLVKDSLDTPALTTDVIVGFPGETEAEFAETCQVCEDVGFSKIHIFPFSARRTTPAADMPDQVLPETKAARVQRLSILEASLRDRYFEQLVGRPLRVLVESPSQRPGYVVGTSCRYAPVEVPGDLTMLGRFQNAVPTAVSGGHLTTA